MRIQNNITAMNTHRQYGIANSNVASSAEKLASGYRINRAGDDAAGLAISEKMRAQIRGLNMASKNSQDAISMVQTAEGALQSTHNILQRMRELAVQSASDSNETKIDRGALQLEFEQLIKEIDDTASKTRFNDQNIIDGTYQETISNLTSAAGYANRTNTAYAAKVAEGTYEHEVTYKPSTEAIIGGVAPTVKAGTLGANSKLTAFELTGLGALTGTFTTATAAKLTAVERPDAEANANQFKLSFELYDSVSGKTDTADILVEYNTSTGAFVQSTNALGIGLTLTANTTTSVPSSDEMLEALRGTLNKSNTVAAGGVATFASAAKITATLTPGTIGSKTTEYNGTYTISAVEKTGGKFEISIAGPNGQVSVEEFDLSTVVTTAAGTKNIDLGYFGTIALTSNDATSTAADLLSALNGKTITISGGTAPTLTGKPASAIVLDSNNNEIELKAGMKSYTGTDGITVTFDKALTTADFKTQNDLQSAIGGSLKATVVVGNTEGKAMVIQTGANQGDELAINIDKMDAWSLGIDLSSIANRPDASKAITQVNDAINAVSTQRAKLGALQNRLNFKISNLDNSAENLQAAESRIRDVDMAKEMTEFTKKNILVQASTAMLAQANQAPQNVLSLLR